MSQIMNRHRKLRTLAALLLGVAATGGAVALEAPPLAGGAEAALPRLLPPSLPTSGAPLRSAETIQAMVERHPELVGDTGREGPAFVTMTLRADGSVESSDLRHQAPGNSPGSPAIDTLSLRGQSFSSISLSRGQSSPQGLVLNTDVLLFVVRLPESSSPTPPPDPARSTQRVHQAMLAGFPHLLLPLDGDTFNRVTVYMTEDGRVDRHYVELRRREELRPYGDIRPASFGALWEPLGLKPEQLGTMGITNVYQGDLPRVIIPADGSPRPQASPSWMIVRYAWPRRPGEPMGGTPSSPAAQALASRVSFTHSDAARVVEHHLPRALNDQGSTPEGAPWLVLSRDGEVLRSGYLPVAGPQQRNIQAALRAEVPDLQLREIMPMTVVKQYAVAYSTQVTFAWVAPASGPVDTH